MHAACWAAVQPPGAAVLRATIHGHPAMHARTQVRPGRWLAAIDIAGEMYHGYFTSEEDAVDAVVLAGLPAPAAAG